jgi:uncharacterized protein
MRHLTVFAGHVRFAAGTRAEVARAINERLAAGETRPILAFDDDTGAQIDVDLRTTSAEQPRPAGPGRPRLGVVSREVTLLPRHWEWLAAQPGGASVTLRKLVDMARNQDPQAQRARARQEAAYRFMFGVGGDLPGFEEASRALFAGDVDKLAAVIAAWPADVRDYALGLLNEERESHA